MSAFPTIDAATISALNKGDESALERIFRATYDAVLARAKEKLPSDPAAAPRLVAATIRELWAEREHLHNNAEIEGFINEEIRHRAAAVRARMAAVHRFEKSEGVQGGGAHAAPTQDQIWRELSGALHAPTVDSATAAAQRRAHAKHEAAGHIAQMAEPRSWKGPVALGLVAALIGAGGFYWIGRASREQVVTEMLATADKDAIVTRVGQLGALSLSDGSGVRLGVESRLVVVPEFGKQYRVVRLSGSGAVTVAQGADLALQLRLANAVVSSKDGAFAVRDYADEAGSFVRGDQGSVEVRGKDETRILAAGQGVAIDRTGAMRDATADEVAQAFAWTDGRLMLKDATVEGAVQSLWRWYGLAINLGDDALKARPVSLDAPLESSQAAIAALENGANLKFAWENSRMMLRDASAPPPRRRR